jgi:hypothetical protein
MVLPNENVTGGTMSIDEKMTINERHKYLRMMQKRYRKASLKEKNKLLGEMQEIIAYHRKSLIRLMNSNLTRKPRRKQRGRTYGADVAYALSVIAESLDHICAERLKPNLVWIAQHLQRHGELEISPSLLEQLGKISVSTIRRILQRRPRDRPRLSRKRPERANRLTREIPARRIPWQEKEPGHFETDLVHHCGISPSGHYTYTLQIIDVATSWSERVAVLGRSYLVMQDAFKRILARLPFPVLEIHPDNGNEFLNHLLVKFWKDAVTGVQLSRSRAWERNDNRFVEQKNDTWVRAYIGYDRLDTVEHTNLLNQIYDNMWLYHNFFQPVMRLEEKIIQPRQGQFAHIKRRFDDAQTPFDRLCATGVLTPDREAQLKALREITNPRQLREEIYGLIDQLFTLPRAAPGSTQDVYETLFSCHNHTKGEDIPVTLSNDRTIYIG